MFISSIHASNFYIKYAWSLWYSYLVTKDVANAQNLSLAHNSDESPSNCWASRESKVGKKAWQIGRNEVVIFYYALLMHSANVSLVLLNNYVICHLLLWSHSSLPMTACDTIHTWIWIIHRRLFDGTDDLICIYCKIFWSICSSCRCMPVLPLDFRGSCRKTMLAFCYLI